MVLSNEKKIEYVKRLLKSRLRILVNNGFYGLLLMHMEYALDEDCQTAATDGKKIYFSPVFLEKMSDSELDFVMMHEILHVVLQHCLRQEDRDKDIFNLACDIVVNSNILASVHMDKKAITLKEYGESMHLVPNGDEGYKYTAEQVYNMLMELSFSCCAKDSSGRKKEKGNVTSSGEKKELSGEHQWDEHTRWGTAEENEVLKDAWQKRFQDAYEVMSLRKANNTCGEIPLFAERLIKQLRTAQTDWRTILNEFVQEEVVDYSFAPPDRRFEECPFFLPDYNEKDDCAEDILFMIDTSGSISDDMIALAYSEVKGAIEQFDGKLKGWLGFFDAAVIEPQRFESEDEFKIIKPKGGGGTDFRIIFDYVNKNMQNKLPVCIIILTDGYGPFGNESMAMGIPVLWLLNSEEVMPPWGKVARIIV